MKRSRRNEDYSGQNTWNLRRMNSLSNIEYKTNILTFHPDFAWELARKWQQLPNETVTNERKRLNQSKIHNFENCFWRMRYFLSINTLWFPNSRPESEWIRWNRKEVNITFFFQLKVNKIIIQAKKSVTPPFHNFKEITMKTILWQMHELTNEFIF